MEVNDSSGVELANYRWGVVNPASPLVLNEIKNSPFSLWLKENPDLDWEKEMQIDQMIGIHRTRQCVEDHGWWDGEIKPGVYAWDGGNGKEVDSAMSGLLRWGVSSFPTINGTPEWALDPAYPVTSNTWSGNYPPKDEYLKNLRDFCEKEARRTKGVFDVFQSVNEPNNAPYGFWKGTDEQLREACPRNSRRPACGQPGREISRAGCRRD